MIALTFKFLKLFNREIKGVREAALLLGVMGILTKIFALVRGRILAAKFGAGAELDVYFTAFRIPDFIFTLTLFITASAVLIPVFLKESLKGDEQSRIFLGRIIFIFLFLIILIIGVVYIFTSFFVKFLAPGFNESQISVLVTLTRIMLFSPLFLGLSNIASIVTQSYQKFFVYALSPLFYNFGIIFGATAFYNRYGVKGLAYGVIFGAAMHFLIQIPTILNLKIIPKFSFSLKNIFTPEIKNSFGIGFARTLGLTLNQLVLIILTAFASFFGEGSISVFNFSNDLQSVPLTVVGLSYSLALFPVLSKFAIHNQKEDFLKNVSMATKYILFWSVPVSVFFIVLRAQIVRVIYGAGSFGWTETRLTAASLAIFSVSIAAQSLILLYSRSYFAASITKRPLIINIASSVSIIIFSFAFLMLLNNVLINDYFRAFFRVGGLNDIKILVLPISYSLGSLINIFLLWKYFKKDFGFINSGVKNSLRQIIVSSILGGVVAYFSLKLFSKIFDLNTFFGIFFQGFFSGILGLIILSAALNYFKNKEFKEISVSLKSKFWRAQVVSGDDERI